MKLSRFTVRRLMVAVAVVAIGLEIYVRSARFSEMAEHHDRMAHPLRLFAAADWSNPEMSGRIRQALRRRKHHERMSEKYAYAAYYPWLPVEPDPPMPE